MAEKPKKADLNIYLAKSEVETASQILKNPDKLKAFELEVSGINPCTLYVKKSYPNPPPWAKFFEPEVVKSEFGKNSSTGAVLFAKVDDAIFVLSFGQGHHLIESLFVEMNFGLKVVLNILDQESIRSIDKSSFEQHPTQSREQSGIATELQYFGVDVARDLLRAITGTPKDEQFGKRISGMDALKLSINIELKDLAALLSNILAAHKDDTYKKGTFSWVDHIGEVKDKALHTQLDEAVVSNIAKENIERIWLSVPEIIDWNRVVGFKYSSAVSAPRYYDISIPRFIESLGGKTPDINKLRHRKIFCVDSDDIAIYEYPVYRFIYAEIIFNKDVYILNNGKWYRVSRNFAKQVNSYFDSVPKYGDSLPIYNDETEGHYNERVAKENPDSFVLLDKKNIKITGAASPTEPCDLFRNGNEFIHVKRYGGSSVLSHLFNQGLVSGEQFQMEPEFRKILNSKLPEKYKLANTEHRPNRNDYHVIFAIVSESDEENVSIPFFSRISLKHAIARLQAIGFVVSIAKVSVDATKKITKKYAAKK